MLGPAGIALALAALLIGATGTFSPCGLSVVETIGPRGHSGGGKVTGAAIATFVPGAVIGGIITFGALALIGQALHGVGRAAYLAAAAIAIIAAVLEARGTRITPQIRRQLPERWRRVMPMPLAAALYGVLLGIGFTTFVLSFGVWALAAISLAIGDPGLGLVLGVCFGLGRALPIAILAPLDGTEAGFKANEMMCERPGVYLGLRRGDAAALLILAVVLAAVPVNAGAADQIAIHATDPGATADSLVFERLSSQGVYASGGRETDLPGTDPAVSPSYVAVIAAGGGSVLVLERGRLSPIASIEAPGVDGVAVSDNWLAYRSHSESGDQLFARSIADPAAPGPVLSIEGLAAPAQISRPALSGSNLVFAEAGTNGSRVIRSVLGTRKRSTLVRSGRLQLFSPSVNGKSFAYVRADARRSFVLQRRLKGHGPGAVLYSLRRRHGELWSTALADNAAYATILDSDANAPSARIVELSRHVPKKRRHRHLNKQPRGGGNHKL